MSPADRTKTPSTLVVVDDHTAFRTVLTELLGLEGFDVVAEARTGREGIEALSSLKPDVAVIDLRLPDMTGLEVAAVARGPAARTAFVLLATDMSPHGVPAAVEAGFTGIALKSADAVAALAAIRAAAGGRRYLDPALRS